MGKNDFKEDYKAKLICLADECPIGSKNAECPLSKARRMSFGEKLQWVENLSPQEKKEIYRYHVSCFASNNSCCSCEEE